MLLKRLGTPKAADKNKSARHAKVRQCYVLESMAVSYAWTAPLIHVRHSEALAERLENLECRDGLKTHRERNVESRQRHVTETESSVGEGGGQAIM